MGLLSTGEVIAMLSEAFKLFQHLLACDILKLCKINHNFVFVQLGRSSTNSVTRVYPSAILGCERGGGTFPSANLSRMFRMEKTRATVIGAMMLAMGRLWTFL